VDAFGFELGKVESEVVRQRMLVHLANVDDDLAARVAEKLGMAVPSADDLDRPLNLGFPADADAERYQPRPRKDLPPSPALSMADTVKDTIRTRRIAVLVADGVDGDDLDTMKQALMDGGAMVKVVGPRMGTFTTTGGGEVKADASLTTTASVLYDAVYVPGGAESVAALKKQGKALHFVQEAYRHSKAIAATGAGIELLQASYLGTHGLLGTDRADGAVSSEDGLVLADRAGADGVTEAFVEAIAQHRHWGREQSEQVPA
jgi:catalase